uniref:Uncharacterized protein n=1 Tax=Anopheles minimus TaxID=112268 RepID=A0A182WGU2_9DIPT
MQAKNIRDCSLRDADRRQSIHLKPSRSVHGGGLPTSFANNLHPTRDTIVLSIALTRTREIGDRNRVHAEIYRSVTFVRVDSGCGRTMPDRPAWQPDRSALIGFKNSSSKTSHDLWQFRRQ